MIDHRQPKLTRARQDVDNIHAKMTATSETTRLVKARSFYLAVHVRTSSGQWSLRWRKTGNTRSSHLAWHEMELLFRRWPVPMAEWYRQVDRVARELNKMEKKQRAFVRELEIGGSR